MALPTNFANFNTQQTKNVVIVIKIEGVPGVISSSPLFTRIRYGDPDIFYGDPGLVYGGLRPLLESNGGEVRSLIQLDGSSLTLSQKIEPEQGRASVSQLSFSLLDLNGYITELFSPGFIVDDILNKGVTVFLGYKEISYPEDYYQIFRGRISQIQGGAGFGIIQLSDPNVVRRQNVFYTATTKTVGALTAIATTVNVISNGDFHKSILGPDGSYDDAIRTYIKIEDEFIEYGPSFYVPTGTFGTNTWTNVVRGARGTTAAAHDPDSDVTAYIQIEDHAIDMALKLMLSGWNGDWITDQPLQNIVSTLDPVLLDQSGAYILPPTIDAVRDYNMVAGDYITIVGDSNPVNNGTFFIISFGDLSGTDNNIIYTNNFAAVPTLGTAATFSIRSKYDTYPETCGVKLEPLDVDIARHIELKNTFLQINTDLRFLLSEQVTCKTFIESQIYLPTSCYSLTRQGRLSIGLTKPPIADTTLRFLSEDNVLNAQDLRPMRGVNMRKFFNEIVWQYDKDDAGNYTQTERFLNTDSLSIIKISSQLPIKADGVRTDLNFDAVINRRSLFLLSRYKYGAVMFSPKVNYEVGVAIEAGDVVAVDDNGGLQIANWTTGERDLGTQLFEVIERNLDLKSGNVQLTLLAGVGAQVTDRFGTISPSSKLDTGSTTTVLVIKDSYGAIFPLDESKKWEDYLGLPIQVHSGDWTVVYDTVLISIDPNNKYKLIVSPPLGAAPPADYIIDIANYPTSVDPYVNATYKAIHTFLDATVTVVTGVSQTVFTVAPADIGKFQVGKVVIVHEFDWTYYSEEIKVSDVDTGTNEVTVESPLGFTPAPGDLVDLLPFADGSGSYRWI